MSFNIRDYLKIYDDFLDLDLCEEICKEFKEVEWRDHVYYNTRTQEKVIVDNDLSITYATTQNMLEVNKKIWNVVEQYILKDFSNCSQWFNQWSGYSTVRFNRYNADTQMLNHCDHIHSIFDGVRKGVPILSVLGSLNNDYEGGDLIFWGNEKINLKAGQIMVFPSNFMYPHQVKLVTKGVRYSYVSWVW